MAAARAKARVARRHWPLTEKRRIVDLTLSAGASVSEIARTYGLHPNIVHQWRRLYRAGGLEAQSAPAPQTNVETASTTFVPVRVVPAVRQARAVVQRDARARSSVMHIILASGSAVLIESVAIDAALVCAVVAEMRR